MVLHVGIAGLNDMGSTANKSAPKAVDSSATATPPSPDEVAAHLKPLILKKLREKPELATVVIDSIELVHKGGNAYEGFVNASLNGEAEKLAVEATLDGDMIGWKLKPLDTANESPGQNVPRTDATYATSASPQITQNGLQRLLTRIVLP